MRRTMTKVIEAIYSKGLLRPVEELGLPEAQRVRLIVQTIDNDHDGDRDAARTRLIERFKHSKLRSTEPLPTRDQLYER